MNESKFLSWARSEFLNRGAEGLKALLPKIIQKGWTSCNKSVPQMLVVMLFEYYQNSPTMLDHLVSNSENKHVVVLE